MNKREAYKNRLDEHITMGGWDYLTPDDNKELRREVNYRVDYWEHKKVPNCNGKATYYTDGDGAIVLRSYYTDVLRIKDNKLEKLWTGYSVTTMKHINEFLNMFGFAGMNKHEWVMM